MGFDDWVLRCRVFQVVWIDLSEDSFGLLDWRGLGSGGTTGYPHMLVSGLGENYE